MKKTLSVLSALLAVGTLMAQEPKLVSTTPSNRNVILEEYTGVNCQYCPDGHKRANELCAANEGHAWAINIHQGGYAQGSGYTTEYGDALANQTGLTGYPSGTVNRHVFSGNSTALDRGSWASAANSILSMASPVNVAATATFDDVASTVTIYIEAYYTDNAQNSNNFLNVVLLQDNVRGSQVGATTWYPEMVDEDGHYCHNHMLRDMITGQWGVSIPATKGTFFDTTIVYNIPKAIGAVAINDFTDLSVIVFITENHQEIITGTEALGIFTTPLFKGIEATHDDCSLEYNLSASVVNTTADVIEGVVFNYEGKDYEFTCNMAPGAKESFELPSYTVEYPTTGNYDATTTKSATFVSYTKAGGEVVEHGSVKEVSFAKFMVYNVEGPLSLRYGIDCYGSEAAISLIEQGSCKSEFTLGPWSDVNPGNVQYISQLPGARVFTVQFNPTAGLHILRATDEYGDGWTWTNDTDVSGLWLSDAKGKVFDDGWGYSRQFNFSVYDIYLNVLNEGDGSVGQPVGIADVADVEFSVYPNPVRDMMRVEAGQPVRMVEVIDMNGRTVLTAGAGSTSVSTAALASGVYVVRVTTDGGIGTKRFVKE
ncbi:MAG: Omp28-related outer membrane protein [Bacteroidales bacterium]|nr:Omp28-related outer membrane protein [Bacteroidales bacterium]